MDKILEIFNENTSKKYDFLKINSLNIKVSQKKVLLTLLIQSEKYDTLTADEKNEITAVMSDIVKSVSSDYSTEINYKKSYADCDVIEEYTINYLRENNPMLCTELKRSYIKATEGRYGYTLTVTAPKYIIDAFSMTDVTPKLKEFYYRNFFEDIDLDYKVADVETSGEKLGVDNDIRLNVIKEISVSDVVKIVGYPIEKKPKFIKKSQRIASDCVLCGKIVDKQRRTSAKERVFYTFTLDDSTDKIRCLYFPKKDKVDNFFNVVDGTEVLMRGSIKADENSKLFTFWVNDISLCKIDWNTAVDETVYKDVPEHYTRILPEPFEDYYQSNIFDKTDIPEYALGKTFVVFDFETTGLDTQNDTPIELGALKITDGVFTEKFSTLINPQRSISPEITKITNICDADVAGAPKFSEIVGDFYKFTRGAILVGHNVDFDLGFLKRLGQDNSYNFYDNETLDTIKLARKYIHPTNFTLEKVGLFFGLKGEGLHRAFNDVVLTAKVLLKLIEFIKKQL